MTQVLLAVLAVAGTLSGVYLGGRLEHRRWLRDKRLEAYAAFDAAINAWLLAFTHRDVEQLGQLTQPVGELTNKQQTIRLLAPRDTAEATQTVLLIAINSYLAATRAGNAGKDLSDDEETALMQQLNSAGADLFVLQVRDLNRRGLR